MKLFYFLALTISMSGQTTNSCVISITPTSCSASDPVVCAKLVKDFDQRVADICGSMAAFSSAPKPDGTWTPTSPGIGDTARHGDRLLRWDGEKWDEVVGLRVTKPEFITQEFHSGVVTLHCGAKYPAAMYEQDSAVMWCDHEPGKLASEPEPEPIDVPAVKVVTTDDCPPCIAGQLICLEGKCKYPRWTCADKSRILLTAEDGSKHCIKFGAMGQEKKP